MVARIIAGAVSFVLVLTAADGHAALNTARYRATVEFRADAVYERVGDPSYGRSRNIATYRVTSKRPFTIRRVRRRTGPSFSFIAPVEGAFTWRGSGFGSSPAARGSCVAQWTETVWPDQTAVSGWISSAGTRRRPRIGIFVLPDATGQVGEWVTDPNVRCEREVSPIYASSLTLLRLPEQETDPVPLRRNFGRSFTVRYAPEYLLDMPSRVRPDGVTEEFEFAWTLRFTRVR